MFIISPEVSGKALLGLALNGQGKAGKSSKQTTDTRGYGEHGQFSANSIQSQHAVSCSTLREVGRIKHKPWSYDNSTSYSHSSD